MAFIVRQIALKSDGGEIVRTSSIEGDVITIGRNAENGVHLPDLAVSPVHARATLKSPGMLSLESESGLKFELDGRNVVAAEIDAARGAELRFGGHTVSVGLDSESGSPELTVRRVEAVAESENERDDSHYTLKGLLPSKRLSAWGFAALVLVAFLAWPIWTWATYKDLGDQDRPAGFHADKMWESGKLSLAHQELENDCQACHVDAFVAVRDNACLTCHEDDAHVHAPMDRLETARGEPTGLRKVGRMIAAGFNRPAGRCVECHTEHEGAGAMEKTKAQFCTDCHDGLDSRLTDTTLMNAVDFGTDHPQFRPTLLVEPGETPQFKRVSLENEPKEINGLKFPHDIHLSKTGGVAQMGRRLNARYDFGEALECSDCHQEDPNGIRFEPVDMEENCSMCHSITLEKVGGTFRQLPHGKPDLVKADIRAFYRNTSPSRPVNLGSLRRRPGDINARRTASDYARAVNFRPARADQAIRAVFSRGGACYDCHTVTGSRADVASLGIAPVAQTGRYLHKGWFDHAAHDHESCDTCHAAPQSSEASDLLIPGIETCRECHVGESGASLANVTDPTESTCAMCHDYHADDGAPWLVKEEKPKKESTTDRVAMRERTIR